MPDENPEPLEGHQNMTYERQPWDDVERRAWDEHAAQCVRPDRIKGWHTCHDWRAHVREQPGRGEPL